MKSKIEALPSKCNKNQSVRLRLQDMAELAECAALDILNGHGRAYVGPNQREKLADLGVPLGAAILPLFGERWPKCFELWFAQKRTSSLRRLSNLSA